MAALMNRRDAGILTWLGASALLGRPAEAAAARGRPAPAEAAAARGGPAAGPERGLLEIDPAKFSRPTVIDNRWMPLTPGRQLVYEGSTLEGRRRIPHRVVFTVTDLVKAINGIPSVVAYEADIKDGNLEEHELIFFAQDDEGAVWHLGQILEVYEEEDYIGTQAWMVGHLSGAKAGVVMMADPREGTPSYSQGFAPPPFNWTDRGRVRKLGERTAVPAGTYDNVLVIEETSDREPGASQLKYYAQGVGNVRVGWAGDDPRKETLQLVRAAQLGPQEMEQVRAAALKIEERAYVYGRTQPAGRRPQP